MTSPADVLGLDLGGTHLRSAWVSPEGGLVTPTAHAWRGTDPRACVRETLGAAGGRRARAIGLATAGVLDDRGVLVEPTPHLPLEAPCDWSDLLAGSTACATAVLNDADAAALAEHRHGAGRGASALLVVTIGTGVGCGLVLCGRLWSGPGGGAGELGHVPLGGAADPPCACGVPGCIEPRIGGAGLPRFAAARGLAVRDAGDLFARAEAGEAAAREVADASAEALGRLLATAVQLVAPDVVVLGGGLLARAGDAHRVRAVQALRAHLPRAHRRMPDVRAAAFGEWAGVVGAAIAARERLSPRS